MLKRDRCATAAIVLAAGESKRMPSRTKLLSPVGGVAMIESGIKAGERIVISDLIPAIDGMLLDPVADAGARARLIAQATGKVCPSQSKLTICRTGMLPTRLDLHVMRSMR